MMTSNRPADEEFIGYDLGHGETAIGRAYGRSTREPEILEYHGERSFVTAVAQKGRSVKIGRDAVNLAALDAAESRGKLNVWVKFKSRDVSNPNAELPTRLFTETLFKALEVEKKIKGLKHSRYIVGCPSGWSLEERSAYQKIFEAIGLKHVRIVPESRAALMTALEQGYLSLDAARERVLIVDIGSSTTDFTYCQDLDAEDVGHNVLGSGLLDREIFKLNLARQSNRKKIDKLISKYPHYKPIMEYWCRQAKEQFFNSQDQRIDGKTVNGEAVEMIKRLPIGPGEYFEIRLDADDAAKILKTPLEDLNGYTWPDAFAFALKETVQSLGGREPQTVLLTGGASRLPLVAPQCETAFPNAQVIRGAEPEFAIARGLSWLGRFEFLHAGFKQSVKELLSEDGKIFSKARKASESLGEYIAPVLVDALSEDCMLPLFRRWREGKIDTLDDVGPALESDIQKWLESSTAKATLKPVIDAWFNGLQRDIEVETDPLCRAYGIPAMVLSLDDSQAVSEYLEDMNVNAPHVASLETDTALFGTTLSTVIIGALLAKANLLAPLLANPVGLAIGGILAGGGYFIGRRALEGKFRRTNVPRIARLMMTDSRIRRAIQTQRKDMLRAIIEAWESAATTRFTAELLHALEQALLQRANDRAVLFLI